MPPNSSSSNRKRVQELAQAFIEQGKPSEWFDVLYAEADQDASRIPWADLQVNPHFKRWVEKNKLKGQGKKAIVVGCGLGDDAEFLAHLGFDVTAFDISVKAIQWCSSRFPQSSVHYCVHDLFSLPVEWKGSFDFVLESYTLQALPEKTRMQAMPLIASLVASHGSLLIICRGRDAIEPVGTIPWPLTHHELNLFSSRGLQEVAFEDFFENDSIRRFLAEYKKIDFK